jgi:hypothetical protein
MCALVRLSLRCNVLGPSARTICACSAASLRRTTPAAQAPIREQDGPGAPFVAAPGLGLAVHSARACCPSQPQLFIANSTRIRYVALS